MKATVLGINSDIAKGVLPLLDYEITGWERGEEPPEEPWDVCIIAIGKVSPVGFWWDADTMEWDQNIQANLVIPFELLQAIWPYRNPEATVIWLTGSNPQRIMSGYSAYNCSKMAVNKLIEQMDYETPDTKFIALGPGYHPTKIHRATQEAGWNNDVIERGRLVDYEDVANCIKWLVSQPKEIVGGRNICVSDLVKVDGELKAGWVSHHFGKLRRVE